jgi:hypothetical protein
MKHTSYSTIAYTPREDGAFFIYELDWDYVYRFLCERAANNRSKSTKVGPFRVRISCRNANEKANQERADGYDLRNRETLHTRDGTGRTLLP